MPWTWYSRYAAAVISVLLSLAVLPTSGNAHEIEMMTSEVAPTESATDHASMTRSADSVIVHPAAPGSRSISELSPEAIKELMRPNFNFVAEWQAETSDIGINLYEAGLSFPTYPVFGPPPPFINIRFAYTDIEAPAVVGLPADLYETELGLAWLRLLNDQWMMHFMAGASFVTDGNNDSSDAWRFRGGAFAIYRHNEIWTWVVGAIALGRNDIPVVPAVGVIYQPDLTKRLDLIMPRPRLSLLLLDRGARQQWGYIGMTLSGTTWGVERSESFDDQLTYGDWRAVLGWESTPRQEPGIPFTRGRKLGVELGYVFSRDFEWDSDGSEIGLDDTLMLRGSCSF